MRSGTLAVVSSPATTMRSPSRRSVPSSRSELTTSSTKNGLPSALRAMSALTSAGSVVSRKSALAMSSLSAGESGGSPIRTW